MTGLEHASASKISNFSQFGDILLIYDEVPPGQSHELNQRVLIYTHGSTRPTIIVPFRYSSHPFAHGSPQHLRRRNLVLGD